MNIKDKRAYVIRGASGLSPMNSWTVRITKIEKGKIFMQGGTSEFELELFKNDKNEFILEGDYTGKLPGQPSANRTLTLTRTSTTVDDKVFPAEDAKK